MGAISSAASIPVLSEHLTDHNRTVRETCEIALAKIEWDNSEEGKKYLAEKSASDVTPFVLSWSYTIVSLVECFSFQDLHIHRPCAGFVQVTCCATLSGGRE